MNLWLSVFPASLIEFKVSTALLIHVINDVNQERKQMICNLCLTDVRVIWAGGRTNPPLDKPKCGWENELCIEQDRQGKYSFNNTSLSILQKRILLVRNYPVYTETDVVLQ